MNNPLSSNPDDALVPWPDGCTGHRIYSMLCEHDARWEADCAHDYLNAYDRRNLVAGRAWSAAAAREAAAEFHRVATGRVTIVLGAQVWRALRLPADVPVLGAHRECLGTEWHRVPHPSGLNRWYNVPGNRQAAAKLIHELAGEA
jgi:hypothetical protein